jgi:hypothetical protein
MSTNVVDRDTSREGNTSLELLGFLVVVDLLEFLLNEVVALLADLVDICANGAKLDYL